MTTILRILTLFACCLVGLASAAQLRAGPGNPATDIEYRIKSAYLYNFTKFVDWPEGRGAGPATPFVLTVVTRNASVAQVIADALRGKLTPDGRPIEIRTQADLAAAAIDSDLIFVTRDAGGDLRDVSAAIARHPVLLVGEVEGFAEHGGAINLLLAGDAVRCEINLRRAERAGLKLSGRLASVGRLVRDAEEH